MSTRRISTSLIHLSFRFRDVEAATIPMVPPRIRASTGVRTATRADILDPWITLDRMSRAISSEPKMCSGQSGPVLGEVRPTM